MHSLRFHHTIMNGLMFCLLALLVREAAFSEHYEDTTYEEGYADDDGHQQAEIHDEEHKDYYAHPKYSYNYAVHDPHTGDEKQHIEERDGDQVKGSYTLKEADGTTRLVQYTADEHNGFMAIVHKIDSAHTDMEPEIAY